MNKCVYSSWRKGVNHQVCAFLKEKNVHNQVCVFIMEEKSSASSVCIHLGWKVIIIKCVYSSWMKSDHHVCLFDNKVIFVYLSSL